MEKSSIERDLNLTVQELSSTYEELSLLYRVSSLFSTLSIDEICSRMLDESLSAIDVNTAAVLFIDEQKKEFFARASRGNWDDQRRFSVGERIFAVPIELRRASAYCNLRETPYADCFPDQASMILCPLFGKQRPIGMLIVSDKTTGEEFYSSDTKLLETISNQAGLAIENALLYNELESLLLGVIKALVKALEASSYWTAGHTERVTEYALGIGSVLKLGRDELEKLKITSLLHDIGKIATPRHILDKAESLDEQEWTEIRKHPAVGAIILHELKNLGDIIDGIKYHHEYWDGSKGIFGIKEQEIPLAARILAVADSFDAMTSDRPYRSRKSLGESVSEIVKCSGVQFDPAVVEAFLVWVKTFSPRH